MKLINHITIGHFLYLRPFVKVEFFFRSSRSLPIKVITHVVWGANHLRFFRPFRRMGSGMPATLWGEWHREFRRWWGWWEEGPTQNGMPGVVRNQRLPEAIGPPAKHMTGHIGLIWHLQTTKTNKQNTKHLYFIKVCERDKAESFNQYYALFRVSFKVYP